MTDSRLDPDRTRAAVRLYPRPLPRSLRATRCATASRATSPQRVRPPAALAVFRFFALTMLDLLRFGPPSGSAHSDHVPVDAPEGAPMTSVLTTDLRTRGARCAPRRSSRPLPCCRSPSASARTPHSSRSSTASCSSRCRSASRRALAHPRRMATGPIRSGSDPRPHDQRWRRRVRLEPARFDLAERGETESSTAPGSAAHVRRPRRHRGSADGRSPKRTTCAVVARMVRWR